MGFAGFIHNNQGIGNYRLKKLEKILQGKKKNVPLQSQFEKAHERPEVGPRIDSLAQ